MLPKISVAFAALILLISLAVITQAIDEAKVKSYEERFKACEERCQIYGKEECPSRVEKCQYLVRGTVYDDCMAEEEACVETGNTDCYKGFIDCVVKYAKD